MQPFLKATHEMKVRCFAVVLKTHHLPGPTSLAAWSCCCPLHTGPYLPRTPHAACSFSPRVVCLPLIQLPAQDLLDLLVTTFLHIQQDFLSHWQPDLPPAPRFLASSPISAAATRPEMTHFANTLLLPRASPCDQQIMVPPQLVSLTPTWTAPLSALPTSLLGASFSGRWSLPCQHWISPPFAPLTL